MGSAFKHSGAKVVILFSGCDAQIMIEQGERLKIAACEETYSTSSNGGRAERKAKFKTTRKSLHDNSQIIEQPDSANRRELSTRAPSFFRSNTNQECATNHLQCNPQHEDSFR